MLLLSSIIDIPINFVSRNIYAADSNSSVTDNTSNVNTEDMSIHTLAVVQPAFELSPYEYSFDNTAYTQNEILNTYRQDSTDDVLIYQGLPEKSDILKSNTTDTQSSLENAILSESVNSETLLLEEAENQYINNIIKGNDEFNALAQIAANVIFSTESAIEYGSDGTTGIDHYLSVNCNDNGAISIGKLQWHGVRAKDLVLRIQEEDPQTFENIILKSTSGTIRSDIFGDSSWSRYTIRRNSAKYDTIIEILGSDAGRKIQDELAFQDITRYLHIGIETYDINDPEALIYFADITNQYGEYSDTVDDIVRRADRNGAITLDSLYKATSRITHLYLDRREKAYNLIGEIGTSPIDTYINNLEPNE
jgi:hypothetical protein